MKTEEFVTVETDDGDPGVAFTSLVASEPEAIAIVPVSTATEGVAVGTFSGFSPEGLPMVEYSHNNTGKPVEAKTIVPLSERESGRAVVLAFESGAIDKPIVMGLLQAAHPAPAAHTPVVELNGEQLVFTAEREIVLRCGRSSITLTRAGKVLIRGAYLLSRSSGVNRIKGGSVQIN